MTALSEAGQRTAAALVIAAQRRAGDCPRAVCDDDLPSGGLIDIRGKVVGKLRDQLRADLEQQTTASEKAVGS